MEERIYEGFHPLIGRYFGAHTYVIKRGERFIGKCVEFPDMEENSWNPTQAKTFIDMAVESRAEAIIRTEMHT